MEFHQLIEEDQIFWFSAIAGSGMFLIQLSLSGFNLGESADSGEGSDGAIKAKWLSRQALTGFLMMFGWTGLACRREFSYSITWTLFYSILAGLMTILLTTILFKNAKRLHSSGTVFDLEKTIGQEAIVYQQIPKNEAGKISLTVDHITHEIDAIALDGEEIQSFSPVQVVKKVDHKTLAVITKEH